jgi:hypothetical protein
MDDQKIIYVHLPSGIYESKTCLFVEAVMEALRSTIFYRTYNAV